MLLAANAGSIKVIKKLVTLNFSSCSTEKVRQKTKNKKKTTTTQNVKNTQTIYMYKNTKILEEKYCKNRKCQNKDNNKN